MVYCRQKFLDFFESKGPAIGQSAAMVIKDDPTLMFTNAGNDYVLVRPESDCITLWCTDVDTSAIQKNINLQENVHAPIEKGQQHGGMAVYSRAAG